MVHRQKGGQARREGAGSRIVNILSGLPAVSGVSFSTKRRTRYGLPEWTAILIEMCSRSTTAEAAARNLGASKRMPTGRRFRNAMRTVCPARAEAFCVGRRGVHGGRSLGGKSGKSYPARAAGLSLGVPLFCVILYVKRYFCPELKYIAHTTNTT